MSSNTCDQHDRPMVRIGVARAVALLEGCSKAGIQSRHTLVGDLRFLPSAHDRQQRKHKCGTQTQCGVTVILLEIIRRQLLQADGFCSRHAALLAGVGVRCRG